MSEMNACLKILCFDFVGGDTFCTRSLDPFQVYSAKNTEKYLAGNFYEKIERFCFFSVEENTRGGTIL